MRKIGVILMLGLFIAGYAWSGHLNSIEILKGNVVNPTYVDKVTYIDRGVIDTLCYDDGDATSYFSDSSALWAVRFTPASACSVVGALTMVYNSNNITTPCTLWVWDDNGGLPGNIIGGPIIFQTPSVAWQYTPITAEVPRSDFHIGYWVPGGDVNGDPTAGPASLTDVEGGDRSNAYIDGSWYSLSAFGDLMIRAVVSYSGDVHDLACIGLENAEGHFMNTGSPSIPSTTIKNNGTLQETNFDVICTVKRGVSTTFADTIVVVSLDPGATIDTFFAQFSLPEDGDYILSVETVLPEDMLPSNDKMEFELYGLTPPGWVSYDDGTADNAWAWTTGSNGWAQRLDAPFYPSRIDSIGYHIWESSWPSPGGNQMIAKIFDDNGPDGKPGTELYNSGVITITRGIYNHIPVQGRLIIDDGTFYVAYIQSGNYPNCPGLSEDQTAPFAGESWGYSGGSWNVDGNEYMIKAFVTSVIYFDVGMVSIDSPSDFVDPEVAIAPQATIENFGDSTANVFDVICRIDSSGSTVYGDTVLIVDLDPGRQEIVVFRDWTPGPQGSAYHLYMWTEFAQDQIPSNDSMDMTIHSGVPGGDYLIWDPDPDNSSGPVIHTILSGLRLSGDYTTSLTSYIQFLSNYTSIFVCCGQYPSTHLIADGGSDALALESYLTSGSNMYMEGGDVWFYDPDHGGHDFNTFFGSDAIGDGSGSISALNGVAGSMCEDMSFSFNADFSQYSDIFGTEGDATLAFTNQSGQYVAHYYVNTYGGCTFGFSGEFAGIIDGTFPNTQTELLSRIISHLLTGIDDIPVDIRFTVNVAPNPTKGTVIINYSIPTKSNVKLYIYAITGRLVKSTVSDRSAGTYSFVWNGIDENGNRVASGVYFYTLEAGNYKRTGKITMLK